MIAHFSLQLNHKGEKVDISGKLKEGRLGYHFIFRLGDGKVVLEPDEDRKYKIIVKPAKLVREGRIDMDLIKAVKMMVEEA